jgi:hypothetical protein
VIPIQVWAAQYRQITNYAIITIIIKKIVRVLFLTEHNTMQAYWGSECIAPCILDLGLDGGERLTSRTGHFTSRERAPGTHCIIITTTTTP